MLQTDGATDRQTDGRTDNTSIAIPHRVHLSVKT